MRDIDCERFRKILETKIMVLEKLGLKDSLTLKELKDVLWHFDTLKDHSEFMEGKHKDIA